MKKPYFPLFIDISQKKIAVIGGGMVAERRIKTLLQFAENIEVISPELSDGLRHLERDGRIRWIPESYTPGALDGADIVLAATSDAECNERVVKDCRARGILVNTSHKKELCDFYFPAVVVQDHVVAGITASGYSHEKVRETRKQVEQVLLFQDECNTREIHGRRKTASKRIYRAVSEDRHEEKSSNWQQEKQAGSDSD